MKRFNYLVIFTMVLLLSALAACSSEDSNASEDGSESYKFATVLMALNSDYWQMHKAGAEDAAADLGISLEVLGPAEETMFEEQVKIVEDQISSGADAIIVAPSLPEAMLPILNQAEGMDIPVVLADADVEDFEGKVTFIGTENYDAGKLAGEYISDQLEEGDKVAIIRGQLGAKVHDERTNGFQDALDEKNLEFIVQDAQSDRVKAVNIMENILTSDDDIKAVFATSDEMALGTYQGLENQGKTDIPLIGFDGTPDGLQAVMDGKITAEIAQDPYQMGYSAVESAYQALQGEDVEDRIDSGAKVITSENVEEEIELSNSYLE
ncbi:MULTISPECIES: sugar ABC transporter substrate-binding protein [Oceanobacillus]|uniref:Sugar ABC transporter substrate-binding protein n=1 Tax=Oceanobacillus aidingensis TaxID=645964 RepID=A0ABV9JTZ0_9BACI|nr:sugar ABC transporter substrate-binding protein [Oceanobacillus oncorhynchi]MDM8101069.1 sugar ABC transporter substrate-binding protein [Oceanobacillus oncorhynchi]